MASGDGGNTYRSYEVRHEQDEETDVGQDEEEADQGDHIWGHRQWQQTCGPVPLSRRDMLLAGGIR